MTRLAALSVKERASPIPCLDRLLLDLICIGIQGVYIRKAHQSLSGRNDQTIDNTQRTMRAYFESGSDS